MSPGPHEHACCGPGHQPTMADYIDGGLRRMRRTLPTGGPECRDDEGRTVCFSIRITDDVIEDVSFRATTCVTLVAYCEVAARRVGGLSIRGAMGRLRAADLAVALPSVPPARWDSARLASRALVAALSVAARDARP